MKLRIKALFIDYLFIILYLLILFSLFLFIYFIFFDGIPEMTEKQSQWIAFLTTVLPITIVHITLESRKPYASLGKQKIGLVVSYKYNPLLSSIIRNIFKFMPWQFAHFAVIRGVYYNFNSFFVIIFYSLSILLPLLYILLFIYSSNHRHLPDILTGSKVIIKGKEIQ